MILLLNAINFWLMAHMYFAPPSQIEVNVKNAKQNFSNHQLADTKTADTKPKKQFDTNGLLQ